MKLFKPKSSSGFVACILFLLVGMLIAASAIAGEKEAAQGQVLTMTGLKNEPVKSVAEMMKFYGLRRESSVAVPPASSEKE